MDFPALSSLVPGTWQVFVDKPTGDEVVEWAIRALEADLDTPNLRILAGLNRPTSWFEVEPYLQKTLAELGISPYPSEEQARRLHALEIAEELLSGRRAAPAALEDFHQAVLSPLGHPQDLQDWCYLWEGLDPVTFATLDNVRQQQLALKAAEALLHGHGLYQHDA